MHTLNSLFLILNTKSLFLVISKYSVTVYWMTRSVLALVMLQ